jgi:hypothetical protein
MSGHSPDYLRRRRDRMRYERARAQVAWAFLWSVVIIAALVEWSDSGAPGRFLLDHLLGR